MQGLPQVLLPRMLDVKDVLLMPALAAREENVVSGLANLMAELGQAVQNRASPFLSVHQCILTSLSINYCTSRVRWICIQILEMPLCATNHGFKC